MLGLNERQRAVLADKVPDMANLVTAALVIGFVVGEPATSWPLVAAASAAWTGVLLVAVLMSGNKG